MPARSGDPGNDFGPLERGFPDYQKMLTDAYAGRFSHPGVYHADRFGRDTLEGMQAATNLIKRGIKIRVAHMPSLQPEIPDGFFMFVLQMGLAQREVDILRQRTADGMKAKLQAGGWPHKAPDGYVNKEHLVKSNKYHRWVETDPARKQVLREAWDLLLAGRLTMAEICEELTARGYVRGSGKPWAWDHPQTGKRQRATTQLHRIFHNPFYAGWVVSEPFGISFGQVQGQWEPIVTSAEFEQGLTILRKRDREKSRQKRHFYLLRNLLWVQVGGRCYRLYGSTPTGNTRSYHYYLTHAKPQGKKLRFRCQAVDRQIFGWLAGITIDGEKLPGIREVYRAEVTQFSQADRDKRMNRLQRQIAQLKQDEAQMVRLLLGEKITEETYDQLRREWQEKVQNTEHQLADLEREATRYVNDLDVALILLTQASSLYSRLEEKQRATLLQILAKRIIVDTDGVIIDHELHSPFAYLRALVDEQTMSDPDGRGSEQIHKGASCDPGGGSHFLFPTSAKQMRPLLRPPPCRAYHLPRPALPVNMLAPARSMMYEYIGRWYRIL